MSYRYHYSTDWLRIQEFLIELSFRIPISKMLLILTVSYLNYAHVINTEQACFRFCHEYVNEPEYTILIIFLGIVIIPLVMKLVLVSERKYYKKDSLHVPVLNYTISLRDYFYLSFFNFLIYKISKYIRKNI